MSQKAYGIYNPDGIYFVTFTVVNWIDVFIRERYKIILVDSLKYCQENKGLEVFAWCVMSSHIHLIIRAKEGFHLSNIIRDFKKYTASQLLASIADKTQPESRREWLLWMFERNAKRNSRNSKYQFWQQNNHAEELFTPHFMEQKLNYIHQNPVVEGWVAEPTHYLYSSAGNYEGQIRRSKRTHPRPIFRVRFVKNNQFLSFWGVKSGIRWYYFIEQLCAKFEKSPQKPKHFLLKIIIFVRLRGCNL